MRFILILLFFPLTAQASVFNEVNQVRIQNHLEPLKYDSRLAYGAAFKGIDLLSNPFSHYTPEGYTANYFLSKAGYSKGNCLVGENLARGYEPEEVVSKWLDSSTHKAVILNPKFTHSGTSVVKGQINGQVYYYIVQMFGNCI